MMKARGLIRAIILLYHTLEVDHKPQKIAETQDITVKFII